MKVLELKINNAALESTCSFYSASHIIESLINMRLTKTNENNCYGEIETQVI